jgi:hypothetical protein
MLAVITNTASLSEVFSTEAFHFTGSRIWEKDTDVVKVLINSRLKLRLNAIKGFFIVGFNPQIYSIVNV